MQRRRGFTLIEIMVVITILLVLTVLVVSVYNINASHLVVGGGRGLFGCGFDSGGDAPVAVKREQLSIEGRPVLRNGRFTFTFNVAFTFAPSSSSPL
jgi:prepilin-type N-terminal cleavage/methylation domain-containing protein